MSGTTSRHMRTAPKRLVSKVSRQIAVDESTTFASVASGYTPALLTRTLGAPWCFSTCSTKRRTLLVSFTSSGKAATFAPSLRREASALSHFTWSRAPTTTNRSDLSRCLGISGPIPLLPPVTMAILWLGMGSRTNGNGLYDNGYAEAAAFRAPGRLRRPHFPRLRGGARRGGRGERRLRGLRLRYGAALRSAVPLRVVFPRHRLPRALAHRRSRGGERGRARGPGRGAPPAPGEGVGSYVIGRWKESRGDPMVSGPANPPPIRSGPQ